MEPPVATLPQREAPGTPAAWFHSRTRRRLVQASLFLADLFLAALIVGLLLKIRGPLGFLALALCVLALALGAWLTCLALWLEKSEDE
jgi:ABC-type tungstate transport system substrate-binding protein